MSESGDRQRYLFIYRTLQHAGYGPQVEERNGGLMLVALAGRHEPVDLLFFSDKWDYDRLAGVLEAFARAEGLEV